MEKRNIEATREALLQAAGRLMTVCSDPSEVTSRAITKEAGVNLAMINYCFGSREALLFEVFSRLQHEAEQQNPVFRSIVQSEMPPKRSREAEEEFLRKYPKKAAWLKKRLDQYASAVCGRERIRSSALRLFCVIREYLLKAGELTGLGEDVFMLYLEETRELLSGKSGAADKIPERKRIYTEQLAMPNFPSVLLGRFVPGEYMGEDAPAGSESMICGTAGSCGLAEGRVRVLTSPEDSEALEKGEILVVPAANIGWIRVFPKIAALVTDVGAPLSHAVIVARELGIPAVVNCGSASQRLKTGDRVCVDGSNGKVFLRDTHS